MLLTTEQFTESAGANMPALQAVHVVAADATPVYCPPPHLRQSPLMGRGVYFPGSQLSQDCAAEMYSPAEQLRQRVRFGVLNSPEAHFLHEVTPLWRSAVDASSLL